MSMKYKVLLCLVLVLAVSASAALAGSVKFYEENFQDPDHPTQVKTLAQLGWQIASPWANVDNVSSKPGIPAPTAPNADPAGPAGLVFDRTADYGASASGTVVTTAIDCSKKTSVQLSFLRSLTIQDSKYDVFTVEVSNDNTTYVQIYKNPHDPDTNNENLTDPAWQRVSYDISSVADNQSKVYLRFKLVANTNNNDPDGNAIPNLHGPAIDDLILTGAAGDAAYSVAMGPTFPAGMVPDAGSIWQIGPAAAGGGQTQIDETVIPNDTYYGVGADPGTNSAGVAGNIIGTVLGGNYPAGMVAPTAPQYLTWGPFDLTGMQSVQLQFQRWLDIGAGNRDKVSIQLHVRNADDDIADGPEPVFEDKTGGTINQASATKVWKVSTFQHYTPLTIRFKYNTNDLADGEQFSMQYTLDASKSNPVWVSFLHGGDIIDAAGNTDNSVDNSFGDGKGVVRVTFGGSDFATPADYTNAQDNANFGVRVVVMKTSGDELKTDSKATGIVSDMLIKGMLWTYVYQNDVNVETHDNPGAKNDATKIGIGKGAWSAQTYALAAANGNKAVSVRWSIGPTDSGFNTEYGGWNLDAINLVEAAREWSSAKMTTPYSMGWGTTAGIQVPAKNTGTSTWDDTYKLYEAQGLLSDTVVDPGHLGEPTNTIDVVEPDVQPIDRWNVGSVKVGTNTAADATFTFKPTITAPPLSAVVYATPVKVTDPGDPELSVLNSDWNMANKTAFGSTDFLPTYRGGSIANAGIVTTRFGDIAPAAEDWARYYIEELAGRSPMIVQGYTPITYGPAGQITRDQIAVFMARAANLDQVGPWAGAPHFSDVPTDYWAYGAVEACKKDGIVTGYKNNTYDPTGTVDRKAMSKFVVNGAHLTLQAAPTPAKKADEIDLVNAGTWFTDVELVTDDTVTPKLVRNDFADYINTLSKANIVSGYEAGVSPDDKDIKLFAYKPDVVVTRDQLAVFVWRAFMRDAASAVVLGGPSITAVALDNGEADYYGYTESGTPFTSGPFLGPDTDIHSAKYPAKLAEAGDEGFAYITLDAVRLANVATLPALIGGGATPGLDVTFTLNRVTGTSGPTTPAQSATVSIPAVQINQWIADVTGSSASGEPYRNVVWAIPTGLQGDYTLTVSVEGNLLGHTEDYSVVNNMWGDNFDATDHLADWIAGGLPVAPGPAIYPLSYSTDDVDQDTRDATLDKLYHGEGSLELQKTQSMTQVFSTAGRHNIRVSFFYAAAGLGSDKANAAWSPDFGTAGASAQWNPFENDDVTFPVAPPTAFADDPVVFSLGNGNPNKSPKVIGADDNSNFAIQFSVNTGGSGKAYFDDLLIDGT